MNEKSFDRNPEIFESDPMESGCESDSQPEVVKVELDIALKQKRINTD